MLHLFNEAVANWSSVYSNHAAVRTAVTFLHLAGLIGGGGCAIAADRATIIAARLNRSERRLQLGSLQSTHRIVLFGLAIVIVSGLLLFASDLDAFLYSRFFWLKMVLVGLLSLNGVVLIAAERQAQRDEQGDAGWGALRFTAFSSLVLWFATTLVGAALPNIG